MFNSKYDSIRNNSHTTASKMAMRSSKSHIKSDAHLIRAREAFETGDQSDHHWLRINKEKKNSPADQGWE